MYKRFAAMAALVPMLAFAQSPFSPGSLTYSIPVTASSSTPVQIVPSYSTDATCSQYWVANVGATSAYVAFGVTSSVTAAVPAAGSPANGYLVPAGAAEAIGAMPAAWVAAISSGSTTLNVTCGKGVITGVGAAGGGTSSSVPQNTGSTSTIVAVPVLATTSTTVLAASGTRLEAHLNNLTANDCQMVLGPTATAGTGDTVASKATLIEDRWFGPMSVYCTSAGNIAVEQVNP